MNVLCRANAQTQRDILVSSNAEKGQAIVIVALGLVLLMLAAGLGIDMGYLRYERRRAQMAADSAAIAGAAEVAACEGTPQCPVMVTAGQTSSSYNGFAATNPEVNVAINNPPLSGPHTGDTNYVEAVVSQNTPVYFMKILGPSTSSYTVSARAVAYPGPGPGCIYALNELDLEGGGQDDAWVQSQCAAIDSGAIVNKCINCSSYAFDTGGTIYGSGQAPADQYKPPPVKGAPAGNPLPYLSTLQPPGGGARSCTPNGATFLCTPGTYPGPLTVTGSATWNFQPGVYVLQQGLSISGTAVVQQMPGTAGGITFFVDGGAVSINSGTTYSNAQQQCDPLNIGATVRLSAPTDPKDTYAGILFIQPPAPLGTQVDTITLNNGDVCGGPTPGNASNASYLWGVLYFPTADLTLNGTGYDPCSSPLPRFTTVIASTLEFEGNDNFGVYNNGVNDCSGFDVPYPFNPALPDPIKDAVLVE
jgi:Putative Flp pilus-assembly TadE/G-like